MKYCKGLTQNGELCKRQVKDEEDFCYQHTNTQGVNFTAKDYHVSHLTTYAGLISILKMKKIVSRNDLGEEWSGFLVQDEDDVKKEMRSDYDKSVFTSVIFPYYNDNEIRWNEIDYTEINHTGIKYTFNTNRVKNFYIYLIFKSKILKRCHHWCPGWYFGKVDKECQLYDKKKSLTSNLNSWHNNESLKEQIEYYYLKDGWRRDLMFGNLENEAVFHESISLDDLECIYINPKGYTEELMKIIDLYPEYNWVTTNPFE